MDAEEGVFRVESHKHCRPCHLLHSTSRVLRRHGFTNKQQCTSTVFKFLKTVVFIFSLQLVLCVRVRYRVLQHRLPLHCSSRLQEPRMGGRSQRHIRCYWRQKATMNEIGVVLGNLLMFLPNILLLFIRIHYILQS